MLDNFYLSIILFFGFGTIFNAYENFNKNGKCANLKHANSKHS